MTRPRMSNREIADVLDHVAQLLEQKDANRFRIDSYRKAADTVRQADGSIAARCKEQGPSELERLPGIGEKLARSIREIVETGRLRLADRLQAETAPEDLLTQVPGVGEKLAGRLHRELGIDSLEELETAAHDGRLENLSGIGRKRLAGIRGSLAAMLSRSARRRARRRQKARGETDQDKPAGAERQRPTVETLLDVDAEYRRKAEKDELRKIAPRRFNPEDEAWLPILRTEREGWSFTVLFSNTARAHERGKTHDWVVIYFEKDGAEDQCTVITSERGPLQGRRVVQGRESECRQHYAAALDG